MPSSITNVRHIAAFALSIAGTLLLVGLVITKTLVAYLAAEAPARALLIDANEPLVLIARADSTINQSVWGVVGAGGGAGADERPSTERFAFSSIGAAPGQVSTAAGGGASAAVGASAPAAVGASAPAARGGETSNGQAGGRAPAIPAHTATAVQASLEAALQREPLNARAFRLLGQLADVAGDNARAGELMRQAVSQSLRETLAVYWLMLDSSARNNDVDAIHKADILLRTRSQFVSYVMPALVKAAETQSSIEALTNVLASRPPWRPQFFGALPGSITDARTPLALLLALKGTKAPPGSDDSRGYLEFLIARKFYDLSYYTWLQLMSVEQLAGIGFLYNGSFETPSSAMPFDWVFQAGQGVTIDVAPRLDLLGQRALLIEFSNGRVELGGVHQVTMLAPGQYVMKGALQGNITGRRGLVWRMSCLGDAPKQLGQSKIILGNFTTWTEFDYVVDVPESGCRAQRVSLVLDARSVSEQLVTGRIWFDDLRIARSRDIIR